MNLTAKVIKYIVTTSFSLIFFIKEHKISRKHIIQDKISERKQKSLRNLSKSEALDKRRRLPTLPHCSTIGASELNFSVRNGKRWDLTAITT